MAFTAITFAQLSFTSSAYTSPDFTAAPIANGDFNNDGSLDLVTVNASTWSFYKGVGGGKFAKPVSQPLAQNLGQAVAADLNGDGKLDLAVAPQATCGTSGAVTILLENGAGKFT